MKNSILVLNAIAVFMILGACHPKVSVDDSPLGPVPGGSPPARPTTDQLQISDGPTDGKYNSVETNSATGDTIEKSFFYTPLDSIALSYGNWALSGIECNLGNIEVHVFLDEYTANDFRLATSEMIPNSSVIHLQKGVNYGVRVQMTGLQGCRSAFLSFTLSKVTP